jgi:hypothetical protein
MRFWGSGALRYVKSEERTPLERVTANKWGSQFALSARGGRLSRRMRCPLCIAQRLQVNISQSVS